MTIKLRLQGGVVYQSSEAFVGNELDAVALGAVEVHDQGYVLPACGTEHEGVRALAADQRVAPPLAGQIAAFAVRNAHGVRRAVAEFLHGSANNDLLHGGAGDDTVYGDTGDDTLTGGEGADVFRFGDAETAAASGLDRITDFTSGEDKVALSRSLFSALAEEGELSAENFVANATGAAESGRHRIIYNTTTGALLYDADGSGSGAAARFALFDKKPGLACSDFNVVA